MQIDCNDTCQTPHGGTCVASTAGTCDNLDATAGTRTCGSGACTATVQACIGGLPQMCTAGTSQPEVCDGVDNNCNGTVDDGGALLCPSRTHVDTQVCNGATGCAIASMGCTAGYWDYDATLSNGCECDLTGGGQSCLSAHSLGSLAVGGSAAANAALAPGGSSWFLVTFTPNGGVGGRGGTPTISVSPTADFSIAVFSNCTSSTYSCTASGDAANSGAPGITSFQFNDTLPNGPSGYTAANVTWPTTAYIQVTRNSTPTTCGQAAFSLSVTRGP